MRQVFAYDRKISNIFFVRMRTCSYFTLGRIVDFISTRYQFNYIFIDASQNLSTFFKQIVFFFFLFLLLFVLIFSFRNIMDVITKRVGLAFGSLRTIIISLAAETSLSLAEIFCQSSKMFFS